MDPLKHWVKVKKFNPMAGFVHISPKIGFKQPSIYLQCIFAYCTL